MSDHIQEKECCDDLTQTQYLGLYECQRQQEERSIFRSLARSEQFRTNSVTYDIMKSMHQNFKPAIMCDPCATPPVLNTSDMFERRSVSGITLKSMVTIDCGELAHESQRIQPGTNCNEITSPGDALQRILTRKVDAQFKGFDDAEDALMDELVITQGIKLPKSDYLPDGASLFFPRDEELNCSTSECFGKNQCDTWAIFREWMDKIDCVDDGPVITDVYMHCETAEEMLKGEDMAGCIKNYNPQLFLDNNLISEITGREIRRARGARNFYTSPDNIRFWKVNAKQKFCTETGEVIKYDMFPKNKIIGLDRSGSSCQYQLIMGYTPITDIKHLLGGGTTVSTAFSPRYVKTECTFEPSGWKQVVQANVLPLLPTPNASSCLTLCETKTEEAFKAPAEKLEAEKVAVKKETLKLDSKKEAK